MARNLVHGVTFPRHAAISHDDYDADRYSDGLRRCGRADMNVHRRAVRSEEAEAARSSYTVYGIRYTLDAQRPRWSTPFVRMMIMLLMPVLCLCCSYDEDEVYTQS